MNQLGMFFELTQAQHENFPGEYVPNFQSQKEADGFYKRFVDFAYCTKQTHWGHNVQRKGITYVSDANHPQVTATYLRRTGKTVEIEEDGCVGDVVEFSNSTPDEVKRLRDKLSAKIDRDINYLSVQIYPDGNAQIGWHRHSEDDGIDTPVLIVSTGEERDLHVRLRNDYSKNWTRLAQHGSLIVLPASFNDTHEHAILPDKSKRPRISINTKCLIDSRVYDCHAGKRYPGSLKPELYCNNPAVYVGCRVQRGGTVIREGTIYGNDHNPMVGHRTPIARTAEEFRAYAEKKMLDSAFRAQAITELRGKHLLCWCNPDNPDCHAKVWLDLVNRPDYAIDPEPDSTPAPSDRQPSPEPPRSEPVAPAPGKTLEQLREVLPQAEDSEKRKSAERRLRAARKGLKVVQRWFNENEILGAGFGREWPEMPPELQERSEKANRDFTAAKKELEAMGDVFLTPAEKAREKRAAKQRQRMGKEKIPDPVQLGQARDKAAV